MPDVFTHVVIDEAIPENPHEKYECNPKAEARAESRRHAKKVSAPAPALTAQGARNSPTCVPIDIFFSDSSSRSRSHFVTTRAPRMKSKTTICNKSLLPEVAARPLSAGNL